MSRPAVRTLPVAILLLSLLSIPVLAAAPLNQGVSGISLDELFPGTTFDPAIPTQEKLLGVAPGERPLRPEEVVRYFQALADESPRAHLHVYRDPGLARSYLRPLFQHLSGHGVGSISEIFDADAPFAPRGCIAQAWSVAELLHACQAIKEVEGEAGCEDGRQV